MRPLQTPAARRKAHGLGRTSEELEQGPPTRHYPASWTSVLQGESLQASIWERASGEKPG